VPAQASHSGFSANVTLSSIPLGVELPLHPSTSALVLTASARAIPAVYPLRLECIPFSLVTELNSVCREPSEI
jgi:hypothetical protein